VARASYTHHSPAVFGQHDFMIGPRAIVSSSVRLERLGTYGMSLSPRLSVLVRPSGWTIRASGGAGRAVPTPLTEETEAIGLSRVSIDEPLEPERGMSATIDVIRSFEHVSFGITGFAGRVRDPLTLEDRATGLVLTNDPDPIRTRGVEFLARYRRAPFGITLSHVELDTTEPLQPKRSSGLVAMWEEEGRGRIGFEVYYTGRQELEDDPYRAQSAPYVITGALAEWSLWRARVFVNAENLGDTRLTNYSPFVRSSRARDGRWTIDAWAPLEGRTINAGVRVSF
jgi:outer membrane receptor for ferrienterochelin and colicins